MLNALPSGPYVAVVTRESAVLGGITRIRQSVLPMEWPQLWARLHSDHPPLALLIGTDTLDSKALILLHNAFVKGLLPPTAVRCTGADEDSFARAWLTQKIDARLVLPRDDIALVVSQIATAAPSAHYVLERLKGLYPSDSPVVMAALAALAEDRGVLRGPANHLARKVGVSRSGLYAAFAEAGLPSPDKVRLLFSLDAAFQALSRKATLSRAADSAGYSSVRSLRTAATRIGLPFAELRKGRDRSYVFDRWLTWLLHLPDLSRAR